MSAKKEITEADLYHVFAVECRGDTLIVIPRGDAAGFPPHQFRAAVQKLQRRCDCGGPPRNLIIDVTGSAYPGLAMLGAFRDLIAAVRHRGGTAAVAGASSETLRILAEYGLEREWTFYGDLTAAARDVVHEPLRDRVWRHRAAIAATVLIVAPLVAGAAVLTPARVHPDRAMFDRAALLWHDYRNAEMRSTDKSELRSRTSPLRANADQLFGEASRRGVSAEVREFVRQVRDMVRSADFSTESRNMSIGKAIRSAHDALENAGR